MKSYKDFVNEKLTKKQMKLPKALRDAIEKKQGKKVEKEEKEENCKKCKDEKTQKEKDEKIDNKGLTTKQKKLPLALQKAILKKKNKK